MLSFDAADKQIADEMAALQLEAAEKQTDAELLEGRRQGKGGGYNTPKIRVVYEPPVHRAVLDRLASMYRTGGWSCTLWSPNNDYRNYVGIEFEKAQPPSSGGGR